MICQTLTCIDETFDKIINNQTYQTDEDIENLFGDIIKSPIGTSMYMDKLLGTMQFMELSDESQINIMEVFLRRHTIVELIKNRTVEGAVNTKILSNPKIFNSILSEYQSNNGDKQGEHDRPEYLLWDSFTFNTLFDYLTEEQMEKFLKLVSSINRIRTAVTIYITANKNLIGMANRIFDTRITYNEFPTDIKNYTFDDQIRFNYKDLTCDYKIIYSINGYQILNTWLKYGEIVSDDIYSKYLDDYKYFGFNKTKMGIQSFLNEFKNHMNKSCTFMDTQPQIYYRGVNGLFMDNTERELNKLGDIYIATQFISATLNPQVANVFAMGSSVESRGGTIVKDMSTIEILVPPNTKLIKMEQSCTSVLLANYEEEYVFTPKTVFELTKYERISEHERIYHVTVRSVSVQIPDKLPDPNF